MGCSNSRYVTDLVDIVARSTSTDVWNPVTAPINSTFLYQVRAAIWLLARANVKVKFGIEASDDGIDWSDGPKALATVFVQADGWAFSPTWYDLENVTGLNQRNFFRFGVLARTTDTDECKGAQCRVAIESQPVPAWSRSFPPRLAWTKKSDTDGLFVPGTDAILTERMNQLRGTIDRNSSSGDFRAQLGYQETDTPDDPTSWSTATAFGSTADNDGILYPSAWSSVTFTKRYARFGTIGKNISTSGQVIEALRSAIRIDVRET